MIYGRLPSRVDPFQSHVVLRDVCDPRPTRRGSNPCYEEFGKELRTFLQGAWYAVWRAVHMKQKLDI